MKKKIKNLTPKEVRNFDCTTIKCKDCPFEFAGMCYKKNIEDLLSNKGLLIFYMIKDKEIEVEDE